MAGKSSEEFYREVREKALFTRYSLYNLPQISEKNGVARVFA